MAKKATLKAPVKQQITEVVNCDTGRLYGPLPDAIKYLQEIAAAYPGIDIRLNENWTGYEDMNMQFEYPREETAEEFQRRVEQDRAKRAYAAEQRQRDAARRAKEEQFEQLRRELGR